MSDITISSQDLRAVMLVIGSIADKIRPSVTVSEDDMRSITWGIFSLLRKVNPNFDQDVYDWLLTVKNLGHPVTAPSSEEDDDE